MMAVLFCCGWRHTGYGWPGQEGWEMVVAWTSIDDGEGRRRCTSGGGGAQGWSFGHGTEGMMARALIRRLSGVMAARRLGLGIRCHGGWEMGQGGECQPSYGRLQMGGRRQSRGGGALDSEGCVGGGNWKGIDQRREQRLRVLLIMAVDERDGSDRWCSRSWEWWLEFASRWGFRWDWGSPRSYEGEDGDGFLLAGEADGEQKSDGAGRSDGGGGTWETRGGLLRLGDSGKKKK